MLKKTIKNVIYLVAKSLIKYSIHKGCCSQDDILNELSPYITVNTKYGDIIFFCPSDKLVWRANTFFSLEPETLEWIDSFPNSSVFFDIGANVGLYSLYAAKKGVDVVSFEPYSANQFILNKNIYINKLHEKIYALTTGVSDKHCFSKFFMQNMQLGAAENTVGDAISWKEEKFIPKFKQGIIEYSLDSILEIPRMPFPNYIKIDVDGIEHRIVAGGKNTLQQHQLKELLIELDEKHSEYNKCLEDIESYGFKLKSKHQAKIFANGPYKNMYNHIFSRE